MAHLTLSRIRRAWCAILLVGMLTGASGEGCDSDPRDPDCPTDTTENPSGN